MTRKDYVLIAEAIHTIKKRYGFRYDAVQDEMINEIADALEGENERFDRKRFLSACGIKQEGYCIKYPDALSLPDESGKCSMCGLHEA
jgi:hypothetical protein